MTRQNGWKTNWPAPFLLNTSPRLQERLHHPRPGRFTHVACSSLSAPPSSDLEKKFLPLCVFTCVRVSIPSFSAQHYVPESGMSTSITDAVVLTVLR